MHIRSIDDAPSANDYLKALEYEESSREFRPVPYRRNTATGCGWEQANSPGAGRACATSAAD